MKHPPTGELMLVNLPGVGSLLARAWALYKELFPKLLVLAALFGIGAFLNISIQDSLISFVREGSVVAQGFVRVLNTVINIAISGFYFSFIFAAIVYLVDEKYRGRTLTLVESFEMAAQRYVDVFVIGLLLFLIMNGGLAIVVMPFFFSIWFYFAFFIVLLDKERGWNALAKSRYLVHGMFFRVFGRYVAITLLVFLAFVLVWLLLALPFIGWLLFTLCFIALAFFAFPFYILYEYFRYQDLVAVERNIPFHAFRGERVGLRMWAVAGLVITLMVWSYNVLGAQGRERFAQLVIDRAVDAALPLTSVWTKNIEKSSGWLERLRVLTPSKEQ
ncbi:hypothetical protein HY623_01710 [Candidatus Uhrbacteria bacterium]|nr:hypothetical protein [Candidatus Uhrbacteria bacterium]